MEKFSIKNRKGLKIVGELMKPVNPIGLSFVLHGLSGYKEQSHIKILADTLFENSFTVINFDATNSRGESDGKVEDSSMQNHYEDLVDVINWAKTQDWYKEPFVLAGQSMGGFAVAKYAEDFSNEVKALFLYAAVYSGKENLEVINKFHPEEIKNWKETGWKIRKSISRPGTEIKLPWSHMEERLKHDLRTQAFKITMPVLFVVGGDDTSCPPYQQESFFNLLKNNSHKELYIIEGASHDFTQESHLKKLKYIFDKWIKKYE
jgi:pimeloyl-ACP methyl ester carboxylesterase